MKNRLVILLLFLSATLQSEAFVKIPDILSSGMVLQQQASVPIWGTALPGEAVVVSFGGQTRETKADMSGKWKVFLDPMEATDSGRTMVIRGINTIHLKDIVIGEVWLCAGQSNMQLVLSRTVKGDSVVASANYPMLHFFNVNRENAFGHSRGPLGIWEPCTPSSVKAFSAAAYYFGLALQNKLKVPVGIINASFGGSQAEAWTPEAYLAVPDLQPCIDRDTLWASQRAGVQASYERQLKDWKIYAEKEKGAGRRTKEAPHQPEALRDYRPTASIYDCMIEPLIPFQIKGCLWYQGESNEGRAEQYGILLPAMIKAWRDRWKLSFPFGIVQLPNYRDKKDVPVDGAWSFLRDAQRKTAGSVEKTGLIVLIDAGEAHNIHPHNKEIVGQRMLRWALARVYRLDMLPGGPRFVKATASKGAMTAYFDICGSGLITTDGKAPASFALAGADHKWYWAKAKIVNKHEVRIWSRDVKKPVAVRYAFNNNPNDPNLTNDSGVPASPFRSDNWNGPTHGKR
ncbi:sialate O-acetylesterase [Arachidicoccus terrestris]|uniref:sialate O-acetylesterase n=1 Tax=Arachidicoccus terrestris TaxID=2875539 RepID=UPI001CC46EE6|nr:sialate O-acetylesterase [Arachidicoccus terrestris]UAY53816.1 sialate O-acetylesterase [Arachidicoccus terrestris]